MKKLIIATLLLLIMAGPAYADWEVTASWTPSPGPNLDYEELYVGDEVVSTVQAGGQTATVFTRTTLSGETVKVVSHNTAGRTAEYVIGTLEEVAPPGSASGGSLIIKWK